MRAEGWLPPSLTPTATAGTHPRVAGGGGEGRGGATPAANDDARLREERRGSERHGRWRRERERSCGEQVRGRAVVCGQRVYFSKRRGRLAMGGFGLMRDLLR